MQADILRQRSYIVKINECIERLKLLQKDYPDASVTIDSQDFEIDIADNSVALKPVLSYENELLSAYIDNMERRNKWFIHTGAIVVAVAFVIAVILGVVYSFC